MASRCYFHFTTASSVAPAADAGWERTVGSLSRKLLFAKDGTDTLATGSTISGWTTGQDSLDRQYVSEPIAAVTLAGTVKCQLRSRETLAANNTVARLGIRVVSNDGSTVRGTLLAVADYSTGTELNSTGFTNKKFADGDSLSSVAAQAGDRIVVEIGYSDAAGASFDGRSIYGSSSASDLAEDETSTSSFNGWIEFSDTIVPLIIVTPGTVALTLTPLAPTVTVTQNVLAVPNTAALTLTPFAPTVTATNNILVVPGTTALALTPFAPTVTASDHKTVVPGAVALTLTPFAPTVTVTNLVVPGTVALVLTAFPPTVTVDILVSPPPPTPPAPPAPPGPPPHPPRPPPPVKTSIGADLILTRGDLELDLGFRTAVFVSLFTDARRPPSDPQPSIDEDPRGWWADRDGDRIGSLLWLLEREKVLPATIDRARRYAQEALRWMVEDGMATEILVTAERGGMDRIDLEVEIVRSRSTRWTSNWNAVARESDTVGRFQVSILVR